MDLQLTTQFGPISEEQVTQFEGAYNIRLPGSYRNFLLRHNGGIPIRQQFISKYFPREEAAFVVRTLLPVGDRQQFGFENLGAFIDTYKLTQRRLPKEMIPIANDPFGNLFCLAVTGKNTGKLYFWDHEDEPESSHELEALTEEFPNVRLVADSFEEFIQALEPLCE